MEAKIYKQKSNVNFGIMIDPQFNIWIDEYEGGAAYCNDWCMLEEIDQFYSFEEAYEYAVKTYGELLLLLKTIKEI